MLKVMFTPINPDLYLHPPTPAIESLPNWYKETPTYINNETRYRLTGDGYSNVTIKKCFPVLDALSAGYLLHLHTDLFVNQGSDSEYAIQWKGQTPHVEVHASTQIERLPFDRRYYNKNVFKLSNSYIITTPPGYSCLFVHPLNRYDLPFHMLSGIVDTDRHNVPVNFPFLLRADFYGTVPFGTPVIQVIPFRRDEWRHTIGPIIGDLPRRLTEWTAHTYQHYRKTYWSRKTYR